MAIRGRYTFFHRATEAICQHLLPEDGLKACAELLREHMPVGKMYLEVYEHDLGAIRSIAMATPEEGVAMDVLVPMPRNEREVITGFREQGPRDNVFVVNEPKADPVSRTMLGALGEPLETSVLGTYPAIENEVVGSVVVTAPGEHRYSEEHAELFGLLRSPFAIAIKNAVRYRELVRLQELLADDNRYLQRELLRDSGEQIVGADFGLADVMRAVRQVAIHESPVLLLGETGVGKDVIANHIHQISTRHQGALIKVNCGAIPDALMDSELFGHEKGAFTGALRRKRGRFERAHHGTIFLDEIAELQPPAQTRLLRVLQNKEIERVGGDDTIKVDIRVIAATHRDLQRMVREGDFREDLWFRLNVFPITIPPLRARTDDIPALAEHLLLEKAKRLNVSPPSLEPSAIDRLMAYRWPGNVRELENVIERAIIIGGGRSLRFDHILDDRSNEEGESSGKKAGSASVDRIETLEELTCRHIRQVLHHTGGRVHGPKGAAKLLGVHASTLRSRMDKLGIRYGRSAR